LKIKKLLSLCLAVICIISVFSGCDKSAQAYIYLDIKSKPTTVDAQIAETDEELLIVRNIYEGLLRKNDNGEIVEGVCESYTKSGLSYTFNIREDAIWSDGTSLTADDFVFAFKRAVNKSVDAPFVSRLFSIQNAKAIYESGGDTSSLGVVAKGEKTLVITLSSEDENFLETLTTSICMPCNEAFFNSCDGKYGLYADNVLSNGSYRMAKWNSEDFGIRLYKNEEYNGTFTAKNGAVFISSHDEEEDGTIKELFEKKSFDVCFADNSEIDALTNVGAQKYAIPNICWVMTVGNDYQANIKKSFLSATTSSIYESKLPTGFTVAQSIYPPILNCEGANGVGMLPYDIESAKQTFSNVVSSYSDKQFPSASLYTYDNEEILPAIRAILGHYQQNLCAFVNIAIAKHPEELKEELKNHSLQFAVFPIFAKSDNISEYLSNFGISSSDAVSAQSELLKANNLIPIAYEDTNICYNEDVRGICFDTQNGYIDFSYAVKKE